MFFGQRDSSQIPDLWNSPIFIEFRQARAAPSTIDKNTWLLETLAAPLTNRPITEITPAEILDLLKKVEKSGRKETAYRLRGTIGTVFRLAIVTLRATNDPTYALRGALSKPKRRHYPAITDERELGVLMTCIDEYDGWPTVKASLQLVALTMTRSIEIRLMKRSEILWPKAIWRIPAERMKMRREFDVPLSRQALAILRDIWPLSEHNELVLPSIRSTRKSLSEGAMISALRRMGYTKDEMVPHGFRASADTILNERRQHDPEVIDACLAHEEDDETQAAYNRAKYWKLRVQLMQDWADLLDEFRVLATQKASSAAP